MLSNLMCSYAVGYLYPSYTAYRALQRNASHVELVERLAAWAVVAAILQVCVRLLDPLVGFWLPFYHLVKVVFVVWVVTPGTRGGVRVFVKYFEPPIDRVETEIGRLLPRGVVGEEMDADR